MSVAVRGLGRDALHLAVLASFAIAQPLYDLLGKYPAFFAAHDMGRWEVIGFGVVLIAVPVLVLVAFEALSLFGGERVRRWVHLVFVGGLAAIIALQIVRRFGGLPTSLVWLLSIGLGAAFAAAYTSVQGVRSFLSILGPAPFVFLALFLLASPTSKLVTGGDAKAWDAKSSFRPPIVMVMFDAFPGLLIQTPDHKVDAVRYPNLAKLSRDGAWYRNASNVHENTVFSVPSILDGKIPHKGQLPVVQDHPNNLFTLLGSTYQMNVAEEATNLCPSGLCTNTNKKSFRGRMHQLWSDVGIVYEYLALPKSYRDDLPQITDKWAGFAETGASTKARTEKRGAGFVLSHLRSGRVGRWQRFLNAIQPGGTRPQLNFAHVFFPHEPREYLPDGRQYQAGKDADPSLEGPPSYDNEFLTQQALQRELLQVGFTDRLIGQLVDRLKRQGTYDQTMIVLVSDHGESFDVDPEPAPPFVPGKLGFRRAVTEKNIKDIGSILQFVKYPKGHGPTGTDTRYVQDIDLFPTIADVLGIKLPFKVDGKSLLDPAYRGHDEAAVATTSDGTVRMGVQQWQSEREQSLKRRIALLGWGDKPPGLYGIGPRPDLLGKSVSELSPQPAGDVTATMQEPERFRDVDPESFFCPCQIAGRMKGESPENRDIAVALNGTIVATGKSFKNLGPNKLNWSVMLPEDKLRAGRNTVEVFLAGGGGLRRIGQAP
jgi:hypothetical protein